MHTVICQARLNEEFPRLMDWASSAPDSVVWKVLLRQRIVPAPPCHANTAALHTLLVLRQCEGTRDTLTNPYTAL